MLREVRQGGSKASRVAASMERGTSHSAWSRCSTRDSTRNCTAKLSPFADDVVEGFDISGLRRREGRRSTAWDRLRPQDERPRLHHTWTGEPRQRTAFCSADG